MHPAERFAPRDPLVGVGGGPPADLGVSGGDERVESGVDGVDPGQMGVEDLPAGHLTRGHQADELVGGQMTEVGHFAIVIRGGRDFLGFTEEAAP